MFFQASKATQLQSALCLLSFGIDTRNQVSRALQKQNSPHLGYVLLTFFKRIKIIVPRKNTYVEAGSLEKLVRSEILPLTHRKYWTASEIRK